MANLKKLKGAGKKENRFGKPPAPDETSTTLEAPESAPAEPEAPKRNPRRTGRTVSWGTKVAPDFPKRIKRAAFEADIPVNVLLEQWLEAHESESS